MKILFLDIETFPNRGYTWQKYDQTVIWFDQETCIASFAAKWNHGKTFAKSLPDYEGYTPGSYNDLGLVKDLHFLLEEADVIVAHNGNDFDFKVINGRFLYHRLMPPAPYKTVDTKKLAKEVFRLNSNKLDDIANHLQLGHKLSTNYNLWKGCIEGDKKSWTKMVRYNIKDTDLLHDVYYKLLPWASVHPNASVIEGKVCCPKCGSESVVWRGYVITTTRKYQRFVCKSCGGWGRVTESEKLGYKPLQNTLVFR